MSSCAAVLRRSLSVLTLLLLTTFFSTCSSGKKGTEPTPDGTVTVTITSTGSDIPTTYSFTATSTDGSVSASGTIPACYVPFPAP